MITYNEAKELLCLGILPCIIVKTDNGYYIDYIIRCEEYQGYRCYSVISGPNNYYYADSPDTELSIIY